MHGQIFSVIPAWEAFAWFPSNLDFCVFQRMDIGDCQKIHDLALRADYEQASKNVDYHYDVAVSIP